MKPSLQSNAPVQIIILTYFAKEVAGGMPRCGITNV